MYLQISRDDSSSAERTNGCMTRLVSDTLCLFHSSFIYIQTSCDTGIILLGKTLLLSSHWVPYRPLRIPHYPLSRSRTIPNRIRYISTTPCGFYHARRLGRDPYSRRWQRRISVVRHPTRFARSIRLSTTARHIFCNARYLDRSVAQAASRRSFIKHAENLCVLS